MCSLQSSSPKERKMRFSKRLLFRRASFFLVPLFGSPLLFFGKEFQCAFVILVMSLFWLMEVMPMGVVSLLPIFLFPVMNILPAAGVSACYFKKNVVLFMTSLIMSMSVEEVQLHRRIAIGSLRLFGANRLCILFGLMLTTAFVSFFVSDTAATVLMLPIVLSILSTLHEIEEKSSEKSNSQTTSTSSEKTEEGGKKCLELDLSTMSQRDKGFCKAMVLATTQASLIGGTGIITGTGTNLVFREQIQSTYPDVEMVTYLEWMSFALPWVPLYLAASWLILTLRFIPCELFPRRCHKEAEKEKEVAVSIKEKMREAQATLGRMSFAEGSVIFWFLVLLLIWMSRNPGFTKGWSSLMPKDYVSDSTVAVFVAALMFIWPRDLSDRELKPILTWEHMKQKYAWDCTLLIGAGFAISAAVDKSGLGNLIACQMNYLFQDVNRFWLQVLATLTVCFLTEFASNIATAGIFIPIMISLSKGLSLHPLYLVLPVTISCSFAFCLPIATPGNAIVYASKMVSMIDMISSGVILNIACVWLTVLNYNTLAYHLLKLDQLPTAVSSINQNLKCGNWSH